MNENDVWANVLKGSSDSEPESTPVQDEWADVLGTSKAQNEQGLTEIIGTNSTLSPNSHEVYTRVLTEYSFRGTPENRNFWNDDPNVGYKVHLNVLPENIIQVSDFLKSKGYEHKFLTGGEVEDGKIFTIYTGSKVANDRIVLEISQAVGDLLEEPKAFGEIPYAPRIVGRFRGSPQYFRQYGQDGISLLRNLPQSSLQNTVEIAVQKATEMYGDYYTG